MYPMFAKLTSTNFGQPHVDFIAGFKLGYRGPDICYCSSTVVPYLIWKPNKSQYIVLENLHQGLTLP